MSEEYTSSQEIVVRLRRNSLLAESDVAVIRAYEAGTPVHQAWIDYRQALRDITTQPNFPIGVSWPVKPE